MNVEPANDMSTEFSTVRSGLGELMGVGRSVRTHQDRNGALRGVPPHAPLGQPECVRLCVVEVGDLGNAHDV